MAAETAFEYKYDGARVQIHKQNGSVQVFSRRLTDVTESLPEVVEAVKQNIQAQSTIVEGEVIALDSAGFPIAFQHLMRRFKRIRDSQRHARENSLNPLPLRHTLPKRRKPNCPAIHQAQANPRAKRRKNPLNQPNSHRPARHKPKVSSKKPSPLDTKV